MYSNLEQKNMSFSEKTTHKNLLFLNNSNTEFARSFHLMALPSPQKSCNNFVY